MMTNRLFLDRCLTGRRHSEAPSRSNSLYYNGYGGFPLLDRCLTIQVAEKGIMGLFRGLPLASVVKECLTTAEGGQLPGVATVKESLTVQNEARQADAGEIAELARIEKQLEQKKDKR